MSQGRTISSADAELTAREKNDEKQAEFNAEDSHLKSATKRAVKSTENTRSSCSNKQSSSPRAGRQSSSSTSSSFSSSGPRNRVRSILRGLLTTVIALGLYALALFLFVSLFLLIASMETGADLSTVNGSFTGILILLSQGISIHTDALTVSIIPLGLSLLGIVLLRYLMIRRRSDVWGNATTILSWSAAVAGIAYMCRDNVSSPAWACICYPLLVASIAYVLSWTRDSEPYKKIQDFTDQYWSATIRRNIELGLRTARRILVLYTVISIITFLVWLIRGYHSMNTVFVMTHMGIGARIMTSVLSLAWLPNILIWALAWTLGATFTVGSLGTFSLWIGQSSNMPPIPVLGLFPEPITAATGRTITLLLPVILITILGLYSLIRKNEYGLLTPDFSMRGLLAYIYPIGSFIISIMCSILISACAIALSSGALGTKNLAHVGITISSSLSSFGRPIQCGLLCAWLGVIVIALIQLGVMYLRGSLSVSTDENADDDVDQDSDVPRTISSGDVSPVGAENADAGENFDDNYPENDQSSENAVYGNTTHENTVHGNTVHSSAMHELDLSENDPTHESEDIHE